MVKDQDKVVLNGTLCEEVPVVAAKGFPISYFRKMYRAPFGSDSRWYFTDQAVEFYSGLTGAISKSGAVDKSFLHKASKNLALQGIDSDELWGERADYGSCFHLLVALYERGEMPFSFNGQEWRDIMEEFIKDGGYEIHRRKWEEDLQNDMAMWFKFKKEYDVKVVATEIMVYNDDWKIATPLDIICGMNFGGKRILANVNLKTGDKTFGDSYYLQAAMEAQMFNDLMEDKKWKLKGSFCLRPKKREKCVGDYEISKNCINLYSKELFDHIGKCVVLYEINKAKGLVKQFSGEESNYEAKMLTPYEWLSELVANAR